MNENYDVPRNLENKIRDDLRELQKQAMDRDYEDKFIKATSFIDFNYRILSYLRHQIGDPNESVKFSKIIFNNMMEYLSSKFNLLSIEQRQEIGARCAALLNLFNLTDGISPNPIPHSSEIHVNLSNPSDIIGLKPNHYYLLIFSNQDQKCNIYDLGTDNWSRIRFSDHLTDDMSCVVIKTLPNTCGKSILINLSLNRSEINDTIRLNSSDVSSAILVMSIIRDQNPIEDDIILQKTIDQYLGFQSILIPLDASRLNCMDIGIKATAIGIYQLILGTYFHDVVTTDQLETQCLDNFKDFNGTKVFRTPDDISYNSIVNTIIELINSPGIEGEVFITLYRVADDSKIINALLKGAQMGLHINVYIELNARGDEIRNLNMLRILQSYKNIKVYSGCIGMKVHGKIFAMAYRLPPVLFTDKYIANPIGEYQYFTHISTGNYNEKNAETYRDMQMISTRVAYYREAVDFFKGIKKKKFNCTVSLTDNYPITFKSSILPINGYSQINKVKYTILNQIEKMIIEASNVKMVDRAKRFHIILKCNHIRDDDIEMALINALAAGINVDLIVRTTFDPNFITKHFENLYVSPHKGFYGVLKVHRPVGKFLEHDRIYAFISDYHTSVYLSSADLMYRNLYNRAEMIIEVQNDGIQSIKSDILDMLEKYCYDAITDSDGVNYDSKLECEITHTTYFE